MFSKPSQHLLRIVLIITILNMTGGHWFLLQSVAWVKMIRDYSRQSSLEVALKETFDGEHPCDMCKKIDVAKQTEKKQEVQQINLKKDFSCEFIAFILSPPKHFWLQNVTERFPAFSSLVPLLPPPRSLLA